nr:ribonuclease H-like domain-containing protein [Tanacetum cinerariifolium]
MTGDDNRDGDQPEASNPTLQIPPLTQQIPNTVLSIKLPILKKGEYDIWAIKMEHYLSHTDYPIWERKARTTLLTTLPEDYLVKFHKMADAKEMWEAIKSRFGGNDESKKMQKYLLKQQFKGFSVSTSEGLHKGYDRFQTLLCQLEIHGLDTPSFNDLYINLRVFKRDVKGTTASSSSNTQNEGSSSYSDEVIHSFFSNQSSAPRLDYDNLEQINDDDMEEMDLKWQVAMISIRIKKFHKRTCKKLQFDTKDLIELKGIKTAEEEIVGTMETKLETMAEDLHIMMIQKLWLPFMERILACLYMLRKTQNYAMMAYSSSNLGFDNEGDYRYGSILSYENEVLQSVFMNKKCDPEDTHVNDRYAEGMHVVPPPMAGNCMPSGLDVEIDYSKFTYGPKQTSVDESNAKTCENASCESDSSVETTTSISAPVENAPKVVCEHKVWTDALIIEEYESDSDDDSVSNVQENIEKPSFAFTDSIKHVKSPRENVKETGTPNHCSKVVKMDRNGHTKKSLGYAFTRKTCFVCGSFSHLIRDFDFHDKRMAKQAALTKSKNKDDPHKALKDKRIVDSGCFSNGRITSKGKIKAGRLDFEDVYYVEELKHYNIFSVSQMCDKKNKKGKQHKASCKAKTVSSVNQPLQILHMDLFGPTSVRSINLKTYWLVITDGFSRFSWVYFSKSKDEKTPIFKDFIRQAENQFNHKIKTIRSDNGTKFKNHELIEFCGLCRILDIITQ